MLLSKFTVMHFTGFRGWWEAEMADDSQQDKTEQPTPFRLDEARKKGQVARSGEVSAVVVMATCTITLFVMSAHIANQFVWATRRTLLLAGAGPRIGQSLAAWIGHAFSGIAQAMLPVVFATLIAALLINLLQTRGVFSTEPIKPDFKRINPAQGFERLFGLQTLWEFGKMVVKLAFLIILVWMAYGHLASWTDSFAGTSPYALPKELRHLAGHVATIVLAGLGFVALLDLLFVRREFLRKLRMSRRDLRDETKRREGDPDVRAKRKRLGQEMLKHTQSVSKVPEADVVLSNPTHIAVALQYRPSKMLAPVVLAKGTDRLAGRIREVAWRAGVPHLHSPELARALFNNCQVNAAVPDELFTKLGPVYRWLMTRPGHRIV